MYSARLKPAMLKMNKKYNKKHMKELCTYFNIQTILSLQLTFFFRLLQYKEVENYIFHLAFDLFQD